MKVSEIKNALLELQKQLDVLIDYNNHTGAAVLLIESLGSEDEIKIVQEISINHEKRGHITYQDMQERDSIANRYYKLLNKYCNILNK